MKAVMLAAGFVAAGMACAKADEKEVSYFCTSEFAGGLAYNDVSKKWEGTTFRTRDRFVLKLRLVDSGVDQYGSSQFKYSIYLVTVTLAGTNDAGQCVKDGMGDPRRIRVWESGIVECEANVTFYKFNIRNNRFIAAYLHGYVDGADNNKNTPSVDGGTCTKIQ
jgi:hypothetical protein